MHGANTETETPIINLQIGNVHEGGGLHPAL